MDTRRIFIALDISDAARAACSSHVRLLRQKFPDVRVGWERTEKLHITLKFLGNTNPDILRELQRGISQIASQHTRFELRLTRPGVFPTEARPRILWIGVDDPTGTIIAVQRQIEKLSGICGFVADGKTFHPHVTIGRLRERRASEVASVHLKTHIASVAFDVSEIVIYESKFRPTGPEYLAVSRAHLK